MLQCPLGFALKSVGVEARSIADQERHGKFCFYESLGVRCPLSATQCAQVMGREVSHSKSEQLSSAGLGKVAQLPKFVQLGGTGAGGNAAFRAALPEGMRNKLQ